MPDEQKFLHIVTEALAIPVGIFLIYLGATQDIDLLYRYALIIIGAGNLLIDGYFLLKWFEK